jgi:microcystin-dependent protein
MARLPVLTGGRDLDVWGDYINEFLLVSHNADGTLRGQPGDLKLTAATTAPTGWLFCDGASYLRATYPALFTAIGTTYGSADGTHFNVPDFRGRVPVGLGTNASVNALGASDGVAVANRRPQHRHTAHTHTQTGHPGSNATGAQGGSDAVAASSTTATGSADGGSGNANDALDAPAHLVVNFLIAY